MSKAVKKANNTNPFSYYILCNGKYYYVDARDVGNSEFELMVFNSEYDENSDSFETNWNPEVYCMRYHTKDEMILDFVEVALNLENYV